MTKLNLPPAPEGHFWRIGSLLGLVHVQLRKRVWFFSRQVEVIVPVGDGSDRENAEWAAHDILNRIEARAEHKQFMSQNGGDF